MTRQSFSVANVVICVAMFAFPSSTLAGAQTESVIHTFQSTSVFDGISPLSGVVADSNGALYGVTSGGGKFGAGAAFKLAPPTTQGGEWKQNILYSFAPSNAGPGPTGSIVLTKERHIYGTSQTGGLYGDGVVYELSPPTQPGSPWTETVLHSFTAGPDGGMPMWGVVMGSGGRLFGTTYYGGHYGAGSVFALSPPAKSGGAWTEQTLYSFRFGSNYLAPNPNGLVLDAAGAVYGLTNIGGNPNSCGTVFRLSPPVGGKGAWTQTVLYDFPTAEGGCNPKGSLILDGAGALYGVANQDGQYGHGNVFKLTPPATLDGAWTESVLYSFMGGNDGAYPASGLIFDSTGSLYGTTQIGGSNLCQLSAGCGTAFKLIPTSTQGGAWTEQVLHSFAAGADGSYPEAPVFILGATVYGTTSQGGAGNCTGSAVQGCGTVFQITQP